MSCQSYRELRVLDKGYLPLVIDLTDKQKDILAALMSIYRDDVSKVSDWLAWHTEKFLEAK